jgi:FMN phosphatase YigB (HAD superfamily)
MNNKISTIIFDMDGTLYSFKNGSLKESGLYDVIIENTQRYLMKKRDMSQDKAKHALQKILSSYGTKLSIGLEEVYNLDRYEYFNYAWNIPAEHYMVYDPRVRDALDEMSKDYTLVLLSDAPKIWVRNVLSVLKLEDIFKDSTIFSGEGDIRKEYGNAFQSIINNLSLEAHSCITFGDQEHTDIIPAKALGIQTVFIGKQKSNVADFSIDTIIQYKKALEGSLVK